MSLIERIAQQGRLETQMLIQNDRIGKACRREQNVVRPFNKIDEELLNEYNQQFPSSFEYQDEEGNRKYRKYLIPQEKPILEEPEAIAESVFTEADERKKHQLIQEIDDLKHTIAQETAAIEELKEAFNRGTITPRRYDHKQYFRGLRKMRRELELLEQELTTLMDREAMDKAIRKQNETNIAITKQRNKEKIRLYQEELNLLNQKAFNTEQLPTETEEQYLNRLQRNAEIEAPAENLENAKYITMKKFREKMQEIIRVPYKIDQVCNGVDDFGEVDSKLQILKKWPLFKKRFIETYGEGNSLITADDILGFIRVFLKDGDFGADDLHMPTQLQQKKEEEAGDNQNPRIYVEDGIRMACYIKSNGEKIYFRVEKNTLEYLLDWNDWNLYSNAQDFRKIAGVSISKIFGVGNTKSGAIISILNHGSVKSGGSIVQAKLQPLDIPDNVKFGKIIVLLHKLYYKNILAVKNSNHSSIAGFKNCRVSNNFVKIIMSIYDGDKPEFRDIDRLSIPEKHLYDRLIHLAGFNKHVENTRDKTVSDIKHKLKIVEGEIEAGNNNPMLKKEIYKLCHTLHNFNVLDNKDMKEYLNQFS